MSSFTLLGTGGGRFVLLTQRRYSGGIWLDFNTRIILDPGPGALIRALQFRKDPGKLDAVLVSHRHLDHYNDAELMVEAMTGGMKKKKGILVADKGALTYISDYHKKQVELIVPEAGDEFKIKDLRVQALPTEKHADGIGFKFFTDEGIVTYTSDTDYCRDLIPYYRDSRILIINCIFPYSKDIITHLNTKKALEIIRQVKPKLAILTHFGMQMLNAGPDKEAELVENECGVKTVASRDGMVVDVETLEIYRDGKEKQLTLGGF